MPAVSIITPIYIDIPDKLVWFDEMLQSLLNQTMQDWEAILVDDFSDVLIGELKWKYQGEKRFRWFRTSENSGPAKTRNVAVALAESEAILPVDSDDALASNDVLEQMYNVWQADKTKTVYGDLQMLRIENGEFGQGKTYVLLPYEFKNAMNLNGVIPVTAMHSVVCHNAIGGWKAELEFGREDVEYWLNAGKRGFCGQKIDKTTLLYRIHDTSRDFKLKKGNHRHEMEQKIRAIHADVYRGEYPMGCCGGSNNKVPTQSQLQQLNTVMGTVPNKTIGKLPEGKYPDDQLIWVEYIAKKTGTFSVLGRAINESYHIRGKGHVFQAHKDDVERFFRKHSREYLVGVPDPTKQQEEPAKPKVKEVAIAPLPQAGIPDLAVIERLDRVAAESRGLELPVVAEAIPSVTEVPMPTNTPIVDVGKLPTLEETLTKAEMFNLGDLDLGAFEKTLEMDNWTVERLAEAEIGELTGYPRIGEKRARAIIDQAKGLINQT